MFCGATECDSKRNVSHSGRQSLYVKLGGKEETKINILHKRNSKVEEGFLSQTLV